MELLRSSEHVAETAYSNPDTRNDNTRTIEAESRTAEDIPATGSIVAEEQPLGGRDGITMIFTSQDVAPTEVLERLTLVESDGTSQTSMPKDNSNSKLSIRDSDFISDQTFIRRQQ
jgi:hypothetical protein